MRQKQTSLDGDVLGLPPAHDWRIVYKNELHGAFDVTEQGLRDIESHLRNITRSTSNNTVSEVIKVVFSGKPSEIYSNVSEVINLRNPYNAQITGINIRVSTNEGLASVWIDRTGLYSSHSAVLLFASNSDAKSSKFEALIKGELANLECWYSPIRKCFDPIFAVLGKIPPIVFFTISFICIMAFIFLSFSDTAKYIKWRKVSEKVLIEYDKLPINKVNLDPNILAQIDEIKKRLEQHNSFSATILRPRLYGIIGALMVFLCLILAFYLFPRVVFEIGEGKRRYEQLTWLRRFVIGSIIICGIILPLIHKIFI